MASEQDNDKSLKDIEFERQEQQTEAINFNKKNSFVKDEYFDAPSDEVWERHKLWCIQNDVYINGKPAREVYKELVK